MREEYHRVYQDLYERYFQVIPDRDLGYAEMQRLLDRRRAPNKLLWKTLIAIENAAGALNLDGNLRPDAKYFLLVNFDQMVLTPLQNARESNINSEEVEAYIRGDVYTILQTAKDIAKDKEKEEVSGHDVIDAISRTWNNIKTLRIDVWG